MPRAPAAAGVSACDYQRDYPGLNGFRTRRFGRRRNHEAQRDVRLEPIVKRLAGGRMGMAISLGLLVGVVVSALFGGFPHFPATVTPPNPGAPSVPPDANAVALPAGLAAPPAIG